MAPGSTNPPTSSTTPTCVAGTERKGNRRVTSAPDSRRAWGTPFCSSRRAGRSTKAPVPQAREPQRWKKSTPERVSMSPKASMDSTFHRVHRSRPSASNGLTILPISSDADVRRFPPSTTRTLYPPSATCLATAEPIGPFPMTMTSFSEACDCDMAATTATEERPLGWMPKRVDSLAV